jgi:uncharacterized protein YhbP (UPF0306 family)
VVTGHHKQQQKQQKLSVPIQTTSTQTNQSLSGVQATGSFHSVSSGGSSAEMSKYFPDAQTPTSTPSR